MDQMSSKLLNVCDKVDLEGKYETVARRIAYAEL